MVLVSLATIEDPSVGAASPIVSFLVAGVAIEAESNDEEEISDEEMVHSYKVMYEKLLEALNENQDLHQQVSRLCNEKKELVKQNNEVRNKVCDQEENLHELEQMKKTVRMLTLGTTAIEQIFEMGKTTKDHGGLGFKGESSGTNSLTPT